MNKGYVIAGIVSFVVVAIGVAASSIAYFVFLPSYKWPTESFEYSGWVINTNAPYCADVGKEIYLKGGSIADVAVATMLCMGVASPHRSGLGGSFMALIYNGSSGEVVTLDAMGHRQDSAPLCTFAERDQQRGMPEGEQSAYMATWKAAASFKIGDNIVHTTPYPGSGVILAAALKKNLKIKFVEKLKFAFAQRSEVRQENFGDEEQQNLVKKIQENFYKYFKRDSVLPTYANYGGKYPILEDFVGAHLLIRDPHDNAISITASLNNEFGSMKTLTDTAYYLNNYGAAAWRWNIGTDVLSSLPPNHVLKGNRSVFTSMVPTIIARKEGNVNKLIAVLGSTGGTDSISALAQGDMLGQFGEYVDVYATVLSSATGILRTNRGSWMSPVDTVLTGGSVSGDPFVHPLYNVNRD
ncbi:uncharacterized protein LOC142571039 [Dermacentor variabilis]|uniref:uncharacterized protein LOC142571039 n=1 Tax=Dermacentor variabilis TaxID=34621 RepID=UPI003F5BD4B5